MAMPQPSRPDLMQYAKLIQYAPSYLCGQLEITSKCAQRCPMCRSWTAQEPHGELSLSSVEALFRQLNCMRTFEHLTLTGGDPQCHPDLIHIASLKRNFRLQLSTAMMTPPEEWYTLFDRVRVSLDAVDEDIYACMRGVKRNPVEILEWLHNLDVEVFTLTTINEYNVHHMQRIIETLEVYQEHNSNFRKAIFLLEIRPKYADEVVLPFVEYSKWAQSRHRLKSSFAESPIWAQVMARSVDLRNARCAVGDASFHIKVNGDIYPCCLVGGEAIPTCPSHRIGNVHMNTLFDLHHSYANRDNLFYKEYSVCRDICQWKQVTLNKIVKEARDVRIAIP